MTPKQIADYLIANRRSCRRGEGDQGIPMKAKLILSLCDYSGVWSQPYVDAGYNVVRIDIAHPPRETIIGGNVWHIGEDLLRIDVSYRPWGVLAAPPCCCFCRPGARWWPQMDESGRTSEAVQLFRTCLRIAKMATGWWALENPPGRHMRLIPEMPKPAWQWQPWEYGDMWVKQTYIWGTAVKPDPTNSIPPPRLTYRTPNGRTQGRVARMSSSWKREREKTPSGFAAEFFKSNP